MKHPIIISILVLCLMPKMAIAQVGFQKAIRYDYSNGFIESIVLNENLYFLQFQNDDLRGFYPSYLKADTTGSIKQKRDFKDLKNRVGVTGNNKKLMTLGKSKDLYSVMIQNTSLLVSRLTIDSLSLIFQNNYTLPGKENSYYPYSIMVSNDGYIFISGVFTKIEFENEVFYFLLKIDSSGKEHYFKTYMIENKLYGIVNSHINNQGNIVIYGSVSEGILDKAISYNFTLEINSLNGLLTKSTLFDKTKRNRPLKNLVSLYENKNNTYSSLDFKVDYAVNPQFLPYLNILDLNLETIKSTAFGTKGAQLTFQWPYQSAQDSLGNIYVATRGFVWTYYPHVDSNSIEVMTLTKFNMEGDIVWETIDTVDFKALGSKYDRIPRFTTVTSVNVAPSGSIFVSGHFNDREDIFFIDTFTKIPYWAYDSIKMQWFTALKDTLG